MDRAAARSGTSGAVRTRCFSTGVVRPKRKKRGIRRYLPGGWSDATMPVNVFLIEHPAGLCLFDAGQSALAGRPGYFPRWHPFFRLSRFELAPEDEVAPQLRRAGIAPEAIRWVVLSHLHNDHIGGLSPFARSEVLVTRTEWERAAGFAGRLRGFLRERWPRDLQPRLVDFSGAAIGPFPGSFDMAGDGRLVLVPTPGHTPGHASLLVRGPDGSFLCAGDLVESAADLDERAPEIAKFCRANGVTPLATHDPGAEGLLSGELS